MSSSGRPVDRSERADGALRARRWPLVASSLLFVAWLIFLAAMAFTA